MATRKNITANRHEINTVIVNIQLAKDSILYQPYPFIFTKHFQ